MKIVVNPRISVRHPEISAKDAKTAWVNAIGLAQRTESSGATILVAVGFDSSGRLLELIAVSMDDGSIVIFHAMKATKKVLFESLRVHSPQLAA